MLESEKKTTGDRWDVTLFAFDTKNVTTFFRGFKHECLSDSHKIQLSGTTKMDKNKREEHGNQTR